MSSFVDFCTLAIHKLPALRARYKASIECIETHKIYACKSIKSRPLGIKIEALGALGSLLGASLELIWPPGGSKGGLMRI